MKSTHRFYELEDVQILEVYNLLYEMENKQILAAAISRIEKGFTNFVVDFKDTKYINSVGLNFLINLMLKIQAAEGRLVLIHINDSIRKLLIITKVDSMFETENSLAEAMKIIFNNK